MRNASKIEEKYARWLDRADEETREELKKLSAGEKEDAFYRDLAFGTGGLRGVIGAGTNRMNVYVVGRATQGLAEYLKKKRADPSAAISYDSRIRSDLFARVTASVLAANGVKVWLYPRLMPTPCLSFAVRALNCDAGVMVTASHNPGIYNGYKVYREDGCQITAGEAEAILDEIERLDEFEDVKTCDFDEALRRGTVSYIGGEVYDAFIEEVKKCSVLYGDAIDRNVAIVYSPLNGTGLLPVTRILEETGFTNVTVVKEQEAPDGRFPTCPFPNPEIREAMRLGIEYCERTGADLLLATDPDCDRCGIAAKDDKGEYRLFTGNEVGLLLLDYICAQKQRHGKMPAGPVCVKTVVTMDLAERIAAHYGVRTVNVLTGFKYIGEVIGNLEKEKRRDSFLIGFEESYGYLTGAHVRDKDAVNAAMMICEMFCYYKTRGISLYEKLKELFDLYGYCFQTLHSYTFDGPAGMKKMREIMAALRAGVFTLGGMKVEKVEDYLTGIGGLPKSDVLKYVLEGGSSAVIRPSGTEPKLKAYICVTANDERAAAVTEERIAKDLSSRFQ
ncbi:MAG: phospho-sugar mutase [Clostridia bacterium]|nr:phospho-sugar mutase [Clostridia bacterium]